MTKIKNISCVIIAKNAESTLKATLESLKNFEDVVIYSNNSTDRTEDIARSYSNVNLIIGDFLGFGPTKNKAATYAKNDWILSLDADEVLSSEFITTLITLILNETNVYSITRENYYKKRVVKHCWGKDIIVRIYNKRKTSFNENKVHESIISNQFDIQNIKESIKHYPYSNITDFIIKLDRYSTIYAEENVGKKNSSPLKAFSNGMFSFFKTYFLKRGFMDGYAGLLIAFSHMATNFYKYMKLYEKNIQLNQKD
jgi:glycosyltransferase involved in cell wall biosynthesis